MALSLVFTWTKFERNYHIYEEEGGEKQYVDGFLLFLHKEKNYHIDDEENKEKSKYCEEQDVGGSQGLFLLIQSLLVLWIRSEGKRQVKDKGFKKNGFTCDV